MEANSTIDRRDVLLGGLASLFTAATPVDALARFAEQQPSLAQEISLIHLSVQPGGRYYRALREPEAHETLIVEMISRLKKIREDLSVLHIIPEAAADDERKFIASEEIPGLAFGNIDTYESRERPDGTRAPLRRFCNFFFMHALGADYLTTADHCIANTPAGRGFYRNPARADFAVRRLKPDEYKGTAITFDVRTTNEAMNGHIGTTVGTKHGVIEAFYGPLMAMTTGMYDLFAEGEEIPVPLATHLRGGYWKIIPPDQGKAVRIVDGHVELKASGRSGSIELVYDPHRKGRYVAGNFIAVKRFTKEPFAGQTVGFYSSSENLLSIIEEERGDIAPAKPEKKKPADTSLWSRRLFGNSNN